MPAQSITLGDLRFDKKGDAVNYFKAMLNRYDVGDRVNAEDTITLLALVERHPNASEKIGCGITHFSVRTADYGTKCFWANRSDGSTEKFSITTAIYSNR